MGQLSSTPDLLYEPTDVLDFDQKVILLTLKPVLVIDEQGFETQLQTGNVQLDNLIYERIKDNESQISQYIAQQLGFTVLAVVSEHPEHSFYVTLERRDCAPITTDDCQKIRQFCDVWENFKDMPTLLTETEAQTSIFYDNLGDLKMGVLILAPIKYL